MGARREFLAQAHTGLGQSLQGGKGVAEYGAAIQTSLGLIQRPKRFGKIGI